MKFSRSGLQNYLSALMTGPLFIRSITYRGISFEGIVGYHVDTERAKR